MFIYMWRNLAMKQHTICKNNKTIAEKQKEAASVTQPLTF